MNCSCIISNTGVFIVLIDSVALPSALLFALLSIFLKYGKPETIDNNQILFERAILPT